MKANDIQIGDWLYSIIDRYDHVEKKLCKVTGIRTDSDTPLIQCDDTDVWYPLDSYEPVPLTPEILEKNGFKNGKLNVSPQYYLEDNDVFIGVTLKDIPDKHKGIDIAKGRLLFQLDVSHIEEALYVHPLQHSIKLCGIDKELIL